MKTYVYKDIRKVYNRHHRQPGSVLYSSDNGITWQSVGVDTGKWHNDWVFAFTEDEDLDPKAACGHCFDGVIMFNAINDLSTGIRMGAYDAGTFTEDAIAQNAMWFTEWWIINIRPYLKDPVDLSKVEWHVPRAK